MNVISTKLYKYKIAANERRFRGSIYVDVWVPDTDNIEYDREQAKNLLTSYQYVIPNSYIGGVGFWQGSLGLDKKI